MDNEEGVQQQNPLNAASDFEDGAIAAGLGTNTSNSNHIVLSGLRAGNRSPYAFKPLELIKCEFDSRAFMSWTPGFQRFIASESHLYSLGSSNWVSAEFGPAPFQELWSYNFATSCWKQMLSAKNAANMPREMLTNALGIYHNVLIAHSTYRIAYRRSNNCYVYTTNDEPRVVALRVTGDAPLPRDGAGILIHDGYLYLVGGTTALGAPFDVYRLNLTTRVWESIYIWRPEMLDDPVGRSGHEVVCDGQHIYVVGGTIADSICDLQRMPAFDLVAKKWEHVVTLPDKALIDGQDQETGYPKPRRLLACTQHKTSNGDIEVFITGGFDGSSHFSDIWSLNLRTKQWSCLPATLPKPLGLLSAAHTGNGCMYIFAGIEYVNSGIRNINQLYKMWVTVPKLSEMCWDAITYYNADMDQYSTEELLKDGIPERFEKRLPTARRTPSDY